MAKEKPVYKVNEEFNKMAIQVVEKYPDKFYGTNVSKICCVNIENNERVKKVLWKIEAVKMPMALHNAYSLYVILHSSDWDEYNETQKLLLVADILHGIANGEDEDNKIVAPDTKGYASMFRTFGGIDYMDDPNAPNILKKDIEWKN